jgi:predicted dehydrogenase
MSEQINRKQFFTRSAAIAGLGIATMAATKALAESNISPVRVGLIGCGNRGRSLLRSMLTIPGIQVPAICDINLDNVDAASRMLSDTGHAKPESFSRGPEDFRGLLALPNLDAVIIATPWHWHTPMAVAAMEAGKYAGVEVPAAITLDECWQLVETHERTGVPCMMLENWSFRRDNLAVLNMVRQGLLGQIVHCHCAHSHDCIDHWFFSPDNGEVTWGGQYLLWRNADQYPTHSLGPVLSWMNIGCGDYFDYMTSTATRSSGINSYFERKFGAGHPGARRTYAQGDIVTSVIRTKLGSSIVINYDMQLPRPYDNRWMIQGTGGIYNEQRNSVYLTDRSPDYHEWESFDTYQREYEHSWWREMRENPPQGGHGGTDYLELSKFFDAVRNREQTPLDVYDSVAMSVIVPLSEQSIAGGSAWVKCPDFTRGAWKRQTPAFAIET